MNKEPLLNVDRWSHYAKQRLQRKTMMRYRGNWPELTSKQRRRMHKKCWARNDFSVGSVSLVYWSKDFSVNWCFTGKPGTETTAYFPSQRGAENFIRQCDNASDREWIECNFKPRTKKVTNGMD